MAKGKSKSDARITQLALFTEEQPAETGEAEAQAAIKQTELPAEATPPKKRAKNKKVKDQETISDTFTPEESGEPVTGTVSLAIEENTIPPQPADTEQAALKEARLKEKYKKIQEERLAALKKARGMK